MGSGSWVVAWRANRASMASPRSWPLVSLTALNSSMSQMNKAPRPGADCSSISSSRWKALRERSPVTASWSTSMDNRRSACFWAVTSRPTESQRL